MRKAPINKICTYCLNPADTWDHVPPRCLLGENNTLQFHYTPACRSCNGSFAKDEEFFRLFATSLSMHNSALANNIIDSKVRRSMTRKEELKKGQPLAKGWLKKLELVRAIDPGSKRLEEFTLVSISKEDWSRHYSVVEKIIKGLYEKHFGKPLPVETNFHHFWIDQALLDKPEIRKIIDQMNYIHSYSPALLYKYGYTLEDSRKSVWITVFYKTIGFMTFTTQKDFTYA